MKVKQITEARYAGAKTLQKVLQFFEEDPMDPGTWWPRDGISVRNPDAAPPTEIQSVSPDGDDKIYLTYVDNEVDNYKLEYFLLYVEIYQEKESVIMFEPDSVDARILEQFDADLLAAEDEILGGDIMAGTQYKKSLLRLIIDLCERNNDEEQLAVYRDKYAKGFPVLFADTTKLSKFKHLQ